jgi:endonuclease/exonuclease/phosphatase family metal-dependent hydrolase
MLRRTLSLIALLALLFTAEAFAEGDGPLRLRVLTYNVWGVPVITPKRAERMAKIPEQIAALHPDLVAIEEAWTDEDASVLMRGLVQAGLTHVERHSPEWPDQNGLILASRYPLEDFHFKRFTQGRRPHLLWHVDYMSGKGVAVVRVQTPKGPITFAGTHLQASYGSSDYVFVQTHQALEAADELTDRAHPVIFAGDINSEHDGLPARMLRLRGDLTLSDPKAEIDQILFRDGTFTAARVVSVEQVLTDEFDLGGTRMRLSDHPGVLAEIELSTCDGRCAPATLADRWDRFEADLLPLLDAEISDRNFKGTRDLLVAVMLPFFGMGLVVYRRRSLGRPCGRSRLAALMLVVFAGWFAYLHGSFGPDHLAGLRELRTRFATTPVKGHHASTSADLSRSGS